MWVLLDYEPVAIFGLRPSNTTSSGGKSLLLPTPYAIKMGLLDRAIRAFGVESGERLFPFIRDCNVLLRVPPAVAVTRSFQKVLRPKSGKGEIWTSTIAQREYVIHAGAMQLALETYDPDFADTLLEIGAMVNYFGRKGGFFQLINAEIVETLAEDGAYLDLGTPADMTRLDQTGILQRMDDMRRDATFDEVSTLSKKGNKDDGERWSYTVILPYRLAHNGHNHTIYRLQL